MEATLEKCTACGAVVDHEDLFCANCGREVPHEGNVASPAESKPKTRRTTQNFECSGCGASMSYDASARTLRCPFCGSEKLEKRPDKNSLAPDQVVPFRIDQEQAIAQMRKWLGQGFWRPGDLSDAAAIQKMANVYVPYWIFRVKTHTYWTADTNQLPPRSRGDWRPLFGDHQGEYEGLLVGASSVLTGRETEALRPYELAEGMQPAEVDLEHATVEDFRVDRKYARPIAVHGFESLERRRCEQYVPGKCRNVKANVRMEDFAGVPMLLPVWVMAYRYNDKVFRFLVNGQTGKATGEAPTSVKKVLGAAGIAIVVLVIFLLIAMLAAR